MSTDILTTFQVLYPQDLRTHYQLTHLKSASIKQATLTPNEAIRTVPLLTAELIKRHNSVYLKFLSSIYLLI
jgi:hypothetical protein